MAIFNKYFGFSQNPFSITPNPAFLYLSPSHQDALGHLIYGVGQGGGFVALTGEVGTGKTTLIRSLLEQELENIEVALCLNPQLTAPEFVANICDELGVEYSDASSLKELIDKLNIYLLEAHAAGKRVVVIIDEAQQLSRDVLEEVRLLTNLETASEKLLRIILVGQPELQAMLARNDLRQLSQRITARSHISPLNTQETAAYIQHRIRVAGGHPDIFSSGALRRIYKLSQGIPRVINVLCERSLMGTYGQEQRRATAAIVNRAAAESLGIKSRPQWLLWALIGALMVLAATGVGWQLARLTKTDALTVAASSQAPVVEVGETEPAEPSSAITVDRLAQRMLQLWGLGSGEKARDSLCVGLPADMQCLNSRGNWRLLQLIDRPALLQVARGGRVEEVLLISSDGRAARVLSLQGAQLVDVAELLAMWNGQFTVLFRNSSGSRFLEPNQQHAAVTWLRQRIGMADGDLVVLGDNAQRYDASLRVRVEGFQRRYGLDPDGLVGAKTFALLDNLAPQAGTPRLIEERI